MQSLPTIEAQLDAAYEERAIDHLRKLPLEELVARQEDLHMMSIMLSDHFGSEAKDAMQTIGYELQDVDDEIQHRHV